MSISKKPKYITLAQRIKQQIQSGKLQPGDRLPSFTQMRAEFGATPATVERLYALLERDNLIERRHRSGVFVASASTKSTLNGTLGFVALRFNGEKLHPYNHYLLQGVQEVTNEAQVQIMLLDYGAIPASRNKIDGLLIYEHELSKFLPYQEQGIPCVSVLKRMDEIASVTADDFNGGKLITQHLLDLGHQRIACLMGTAKDDSQHDALGAQRLAGYRAALRESAISPLATWQRPVLYNPLENYTERGYSLMSQWLREDWHQLNCTAILTQNDDVAIGVINALQEAGLQVPRDVSVVGFDGADVDAHFTPRLTTIELPLKTIGQLGTQKLLRLIRGESLEQHSVLPVSLRIGQSTAATKVLSGVTHVASIT